MERWFRIAIYSLAIIFGAGAAFVAYQLNVYDGVRVSHSVRIDANSYEVWPYLVEPEKRKEWMTGLVSIRPVEGAPGALGSRALIDMEHGGQRFTAEEKVRAVIEDRQLELVVDTLAQNTVWTYTLAPRGEGDTTEVSLFLDAWHKNWVLKAQAPFVKSKFRRLAQRDLKRLKKVVEETAPQS